MKHASGKRPIASDPPEGPAAADPAERRVSRNVATLLAAKLKAGQREALCRLRKISARGMQLETAQALTPGQAVVIELRSGDHIPAKVVWAADGRAGIQLDCEIDIATTLRPPPDRSTERGTLLDRSPRFAMAIKGRLRGLGRATAVSVENLSQSGAQVTLAGDITLNGPITLDIAGLAPRRCSVRWRMGREVGVAFVEPIPYAVMSAWMGDMPPTA